MYSFAVGDLLSYGNLFAVGDLLSFSVVSKHIRSFGCSSQQIMVIKFCGTSTDPIHWKIK